jgi:hypothetical protein
MCALCFRLHLSLYTHATDWHIVYWHCMHSWVCTSPTINVNQRKDNDDLVKPFRRYSIFCPSLLWYSNTRRKNNRRFPLAPDMLPVPPSLRCSVLRNRRVFPGGCHPRGITRKDPPIPRRNRRTVSTSSSKYSAFHSAPHSAVTFSKWN